MKTVFITGTSSGIGREAVKYFSIHGWQVIATLRNPDKEKELGLFPNVHLLKMDVNKPEEVNEAICSAVTEFGKIDVLVNNAGYTTLGVFEAATEEQIFNQFNTNVFGIFRTIQAILPHFREQKQGLIINVTSLGGRMTFPLYSLYHGTKWAIEGFTESLSFELMPLNIRVKLIEPGSVKTDFYGSSMVALKDEQLTDYQKYEEGVMAKYAAQIAAGYGCEPIEIAKAIFAAALDESNQLRYPCPTGGGVDAMLKMRHELSLEDFRGVIKSMLE
jgi:NAD(P)-dependent dehydrogenase (short-subunit alcohol dehydrogenase family)